MKKQIQRQNTLWNYAQQSFAESGILLTALLALYLFSCEKEDPDFIIYPEEQVAPDGVSDLTAITVSCDQINLSWTDNSDNEEGFEVRQSITGVSGEFNTIAILKPNVTRFDVIGLSPSTTYYFRVRSFNEAGYKPCGRVCATTLGNEYSPPAIFVPANSTGKFKVSIEYDWGQMVSISDYYELEESTFSAEYGFAKIHRSAVGIHDSPYDIQLKRSSGIYFYRAKVHRDSPYPGYSSYSETVMVVIAEEPSNI
jgi:hypothetical protein